ncbi:MAG: hypothetical protein WCK29_00655 [archaeon]
MRDEIQAGLKNALERGDTLDQAVQSFISAGYNPVEVKEAANSLNSGIIPMASNINSSKSQVDLQNKGNNFTNIAQSSTRNSMAPSAPVFPLAKPIQPMQQMQQMQSNYQQLSSPSVEQKGFHSKKIAIILGIILLILIGLLAGLMFFSTQLLKLIGG